MNQFAAINSDAFTQQQAINTICPVKKELKNQGNKNNRKKQRGLTVMELLVVLAIVAIIIAFLFGYITTLRSRSKVKITADQVGFIVSGARSYKAGQVNYQNLSMSALCQEDQLNEDLCNSNYQDPFGGTYSVSPSGPNNTQFTITISGLSTDVGTSLTKELKPGTVGENNASFQDSTITAIYE